MVSVNSKKHLRRPNGRVENHGVNRNRKYILRRYDVQEKKGFIRCSWLVARDYWFYVFFCVNLHPTVSLCKTKRGGVRKSADKYLKNSGKIMIFRQRTAGRGV